MGCLVFGVLFAIVSVIFGDVISSAMDGALDFLSTDWLQPMTLATGVTMFGGVGWLLTDNSQFGTGAVLVLSLLAAIGSAVLIHLAYVRPMQRSENSTSFSMAELAGTIAEVITPIPASGCGEVLISAGAGGRSNQIAASFDGVEIEEGARVVVVETREHVLYVSKLD